jgi:hypothetical protein
VITLSTNVKSKYLAINGIVDDVGGKIFDTRSKNTTIDNNTLIVRVIFSPESAGRKNTAMDRKAINTVGIIRTTV